LKRIGTLVMLLNNGDCIEVMQRLIDDGVQVDSVVTDPPYHLTSIVERFGKEGSAPVKVNEFFNKENGESKGSSPYKRSSTGFLGKEWDGGDIAFRQETWELAYKLLKPGGHLLAFSASRNYHRIAVAIEDAGFEIRDQIMWIYGSGFPKSLNLGDGWGTSLKPAHEPIVMAKKRLEGTNKQNKDKYGTGGINIDGCRIEGEVKRPDTNPDFRDQGKKSKEAIGINKLSFGQVKDAKRKEVEKEENNLGRFPANIMHGGLNTEWARYFYCPKVSQEERNKGLDHLPTKKTSSMPGRRDSHDMEGYSIDNDVTGRFVTERKNVHPTVKPIELMKYLCRLVTPKGGTVLDPFMGSGSTGMAAKDEGFDFIGIEKEEEYFEIAQSRIKVTAPLMEFFS
jgi:site-specific DNA-methyltransferase (adenine-specific)